MIRPRLFRSSLAATCLFLCMGVATAQSPGPTPSHLALARDLVQISGAMASVDDITPGFTAEIKKQTLTRPDLTADLDLVIKSLGPELDAQKQQVYDSITRTYAKYFTEAELRDIVGFFKTPAGAKYIKQQPDLIDEVVDNIQSWAQHTSEYAVSRVRAEMVKKGHQMQ